MQKFNFVGNNLVTENVTQKLSNGIIWLETKNILHNCYTTLYFGQFSQIKKRFEETAICFDKRMLTILSTEYENSKGILR